MAGKVEYVENCSVTPHVFTDFYADIQLNVINIHCDVFSLLSQGLCTRLKYSKKLVPALFEPLFYEQLVFINEPELYSIVIEFVIALFALIRQRRLFY